MEQTGVVGLRGVAVAECDGGLRNSLLHASCVEMHRRIPKPFLLKWINNLVSYMKALAGDDAGRELPIGCSCSGTGIWNRVNDLLLQFWKDQYAIDAEYKWAHRFMCEIDKRK